MYGSSSATSVAVPASVPGSTPAFGAVFGAVFGAADGVVVADSRLLGVFRGTEVGTTSIFNPYKGLDCFYETDSEYFCGRSKLVRRASVLFGKLQQGTSPRILPIVGPSGSGKSSLVRAGLVPELVRQPLAGFEEPQVLILRPGATPLARLADVIQRGRPTAGVSTADLQKAAPDGIYRALHGALASSGYPLNRYLIVVDQFEELFTECADSDARNAFLENLVFACGHVDHRVSLVFTLRNDFASSVRDPSAFLAAVRDNRLAIPGMGRDEIFEAVDQPARRLGHPWPSTFVETSPRSARVVRVLSRCFNSRSRNFGPRMSPAHSRSRPGFLV